MNYSTLISEALLAIKLIFALGHGDSSSLVGFLSNIFERDRYDEMASLEIIK